MFVDQLIRINFAAKCAIRVSLMHSLCKYWCMQKSGGGPGRKCTELARESAQPLRLELSVEYVNPLLCYCDIVRNLYLSKKGPMIYCPRMQVTLPLSFLVTRSFAFKCRFRTFTSVANNEAVKGFLSQKITRRDLLLVPAVCVVYAQKMRGWQQLVLKRQVPWECIFCVLSLAHVNYRGHAIKKSPPHLLTYLWVLRLCHADL